MKIHSTGPIRIVAAKFETTCVICEETIYEGEDIAHSDEHEAFVHVSHFEQKPAHPRYQIGLRGSNREPGPAVCGTCNYTRPCECE